MIQKLDEEDYRSRKFLDESSYAKVTKECETRMVSDHLSFLHAECKDIVKKEKRDGMVCHNLIFVSACWLFMSFPSCFNHRS